MSERWGEVAAISGPRLRTLGRPAAAVLLHDRIQEEESKIFGIRRRHCEAAFARRGVRGVATLRTILAEFPRDEHVSLRCADEEPSLIWGLQEDGWRLVDTSIDYVFRSAPEAVPCPWEFGVPSAEERPALSRLVGRLLSDAEFIRTRFTTDPQLASRASAFYAAWAARGLEDGRDRIALVARDPRGRALGAMTAHRAMSPAGHLRGRIELNAVRPAYRSRGVYTALLARMLRELFASGTLEVRVRTSGGTIAVQRVWQRLGGVPARVDAVFHRPALLDR